MIESKNVSEKRKKSPFIGNKIGNTGLFLIQLKRAAQAGGDPEAWQGDYNIWEGVNYDRLLILLFLLTLLLSIELLIVPF